MQVIKRHRVLSALAGIGLVGICAVVLVAPGVGGPTNEVNAAPEIVKGQMRTATASEIGAAGLAGVSKKKSGLSFKGYISNAISVEEGGGTSVSLKCPKKYIAVAGGVLNNTINLTVNTSSNNNPVNGKPDQRKWYVGMTNDNIDGVGGAIDFYGVVNCLGKFK